MSRTTIRTTSLLALVLLLVPSLAAQGTRGKTTVRKHSGAYVTTVRTDGNIPARGNIGGLAVDGKGRFFVANFGTAVRRIDPDGTNVLLNNGFAAASGNSIDNNGELLQSDFIRNRLFRVHEDGSRTIVASTGLSGPVGVIQDSSDDIFVLNCGNNTIARVDPGGVVTQFSADPLLNCPNGVVFDDIGDMYVVNFNDDNLLRIDSLGNATLVGVVGSGMNNAHITFSQGKLYVAKLFAHQIWEVTTTGQAKLLAGTGMQGTQDGFTPHQATMSQPNGMSTGPTGVVYANNLVGAILGGTGGRLLIRGIHLD